MKPTALALSALALAAATAPAAGEEIVLKFGTTQAPNSRLAATFQTPWAERINEQGKGVLKIEMHYGSTIVNFTNYYDRVMSDVAQIAWGLMSSVGGKFPRTDVGTLPFMADNAEDASVALWRMYESGILDAEYKGSHPLIMVYLTQAGVHMSKPIPNLDDPAGPLAGQKIIAASWGTGQAVSRLGGAQLSIPLSDMYEALNRGTADGAVVSWTSFNPFKLKEVTSYHVEAALGTSPGWFVMSQKRYDALPEAAKKIMDANSGEGPSRAYGRWWDEEKNRGRSEIESLASHTIVPLEGARAEAWKKRTQPIIDEWAAKAPDGHKMVEAFRTELAKVKAGK